MIRISITAAAFDAITATMPLRSVGFEREPDDRGERLVCVKQEPRKRSVMANELIRPIDENTAKAIEESARTLGKGFDLAGGLGAYLARALGGVPGNLIGLLVGDWLIHKRVRRWSELQDETRRILDQRDVNSPVTKSRFSA